LNEASLHGFMGTVVLLDSRITARGVTL